MSARRRAIMLIAGGRSAVRRQGADPLIQAALALAGTERPRVAYVGAASADNAVFRSLITRLLQKAGAGEVRLAPLCGRRADPHKARGVMAQADIVFMSGGDVDEGMSVLREKGMVDYLQQLYSDGKPFFGVSAGSIMLARQWIRWKDPQDEESAELFPCLGFARVWCDTHGEADGWEELRALGGLARAGSISYGICSGAALLVRPDGGVGALGGKVQRFTRKGKTVVELESLLPARGEKAGGTRP